MGSLPARVRPQDARVTKTVRAQISPDAPNFGLTCSWGQFSGGTAPNLGATGNVALARAMFEIEKSSRQKYPWNIFIIQWTVSERVNYNHFVCETKKKHVLSCEWPVAGNNVWIKGQLNEFQVTFRQFWQPGPSNCIWSRIEEIKIEQNIASDAKAQLNLKKKTGRGDVLLELEDLTTEKKGRQWLQDWHRNGVFI